MSWYNRINIIAEHGPANLCPQDLWHIVVKASFLKTPVILFYELKCFITKPGGHIIMLDAVTILQEVLKWYFGCNRSRNKNNMTKQNFIKEHHLLY